MALIQDVKCARCDHQYSALRSRCPYCGTPRRVQSKRAADSDNNKVKLFIGLLLMAVVVVAVVLVLAHSLGEDKGGATAGGSTHTPDTSTSGTTSGASAASSGSKNNDGVTVLPGNTSGTSSGAASSGDSSGQAGQEEPQPKEDKVTSLQILTPWGSVLPPVDDPSAEYDYDITMTITETLLLSYKVTPDNVEFPYSWESSDTTKVVVLQTGKLTPVGTGNCYVTLTVGDVKRIIIVRVTDG